MVSVVAKLHAVRKTAGQCSCTPGRVMPCDSILCTKIMPGRLHECFRNRRGMIEVIAKLQAAARKAQADAAALEAGGGSAGDDDAAAAEDAEAEVEAEMGAAVEEADGGPASAGGSLTWIIR